MKKQTLAELLRAPLCCAALWFSFTAVPAGAQTTSTGTAPDGARAPSVTPEADETDETVVVLDPFVVTAEEDAGSYRATSTLAGTRIRTELKDVGSAISVVTGEFLKDTGATNSDTLLQYTTNTEVGGTGGNFSGTSGRSDTTESRLRPHENTRVRGLARADNSRDFFLTDIPWDSYNVGRIDLQRGPNSILFGIGSPAGMVNASVNGASFIDANKAEVRYGSFGSYRGSIDVNKVLLDDELAFRVAVVNDKTFYKQDPAYSHQRRAFGALRFDPKIFAQGSARTSIKVSFESGEIDANRPRITPPRDSITPWFTDPTLAKKLYDARTISDNSPGAIAADSTGTSGANLRFLPDNFTPNPNYSAWIQNGAGGGIFDQATVWFDGNTSAEQGGIFEPSLNTTGKPALPAGVGFPWTVYMGITNYRTWAEQGAIQLPGTRVGAVRTPTLQDRRVFDYYNHLIDGRTKKELTDFDAFNASLSQTFFDNKLGIDATFDKQSYRDEGSQLLGGDPLLTVEIMRVLPDGRANPNAGRAFVAGLPNSGNNGRWSDREAVRVTAFGELDFKDILEESRMGNILGRHVFTGLFMQQRRDLETRSWYNYVHNEDYKAGLNRSLDSRRVNSIHYLSPSLVNATLPNLGINRIRAAQFPTTGTIYDFNTNLKAGATPDGDGNYAPGDVVGWEPHRMRVLDGYSGRDRAQMYNNANKTRDDVDSKALVWQGFFLDGVIVPTVGFRKDVAENFNAGDVPQDPVDQSRYVNDPNWTITTGASDPRLNPMTGIGARNERYSRVSGDSTSWSIVLHTPRAIREKLPFGSNLSLFYNRSDNFEAATGRTDVYGNTIPNPTGETEDYGFVVSVLDDKVSFKANWYETSVNDATIEAGTGGLQAVYRLGLNENWGRAFGNWAKNAVPGTGFDANYALTDPNLPESVTNPRLNPSIGNLRYQPSPEEANQGAAQAVALAYQRQTLAIDTLLANPPPADFAAHWTIQLEQNWAGGWGSHVGANQPSSLAVTGDTFSKGVEFELAANPVPNWNIAINASKTTATRSNLAKGFADWAETRAEFFRGPGGQVQLWNGNWGQQTVGGVWLSEFYSSFLLYKQLENSEVPELRPWRFNVVTNYSFRRGPLEGVNIGGAYRWQDKTVIGFGLTGAGTPDEAWDVSQKYYGPSEDALDLWVGYQRNLSDSIGWRVQLNIRNALADKALIPISTQPNGSMAVGRIPEPTTWSITNTFTF